MLKQIEARGALNGLPDDATEEKRAEAIKALADADKALKELLERKTPEPLPADLGTRIQMRSYLDAFIQGREVTGAELEANQGLKLDPARSIPWAALDPGATRTEERADADPPAISPDVNRRTDTILRRVFATTDAGFLGIAMPSVPPGTAVYPVFGGQATGQQLAADAPADAAAWDISVSALTPTRASVRYLLNIENVAAIGGEAEDLLRSDMRAALGQLVDEQVINGGGDGANVNGIRQRLGGNPADPGDVATAEAFRNLAIDAVDNRWTPDEMSQRFLMGSAAYKFGRRTFLDPDNKTIDAVQSMRNLGAGIRQSSRIAAKADGKVDYYVRTSQPMAAVMPVWEGLSVIRDPYTGSSKAQIALTAHMLYAFTLRRTDGWHWGALKLAA